MSKCRHEVVYQGLNESYSCVVCRDTVNDLKKYCAVQDGYYGVSSGGDWVYYPVRILDPVKSSVLEQVVSSVRQGLL